MLSSTLSLVLRGRTQEMAEEELSMLSLSGRVEKGLDTDLTDAEQLISLLV